MKINRFQPARSALLIALAATLGACGTTPRNPLLVEAETAYAKAAADPQVIRSASTDLHRAQIELQKADAAAAAGDDTSAVEHYAYLAKQRTAVALEASQINQSEQAVSRAQAERDRILINARTNEAEARSRDAIAARKLAEERLAAAQQARQQAADADARASALEAELSQLKARKTERGMVLTLGDVLFDTGRATLKPGAMRTVDQLAQFLEKNPARRVLVEGHTDSVGSSESNRTLSQRRAEAVQMALADRRIGSSRVDVHGMGEDYPVASNDNAAGRQQNRRVEIIFSDDSGAIKARNN